MTPTMNNTPAVAPFAMAESGSPKQTEQADDRAENTTTVIKAEEDTSDLRRFMAPT
jgi:hypothetical protein